MTEQIDTTPLYSFGVHWLKGLFAPARWIGQRLTIYRTRIIFESGIFNKDERIIPIRKITDLRVTKGCIAGMIGYGNLYIETAGSSGTEIAVVDISNPDYARDLITHLIDQTD